VKPGQDNQISTWLFVGAVLIVLGMFSGVGSMFMIVRGPAGILASLGFGALLFMIGLVIVLATLLVGVAKTSSASLTKQVKQINNAKVTARFATNSIGETLFSEQDIFFDDPKTKLYVRLEVPGIRGGSVEFRCNEQVWLQCGEGMSGTAYAQGDWMGRFEPLIGTGQGSVHGYGVASEQPRNL
jgi:hypothetical protein